MAHKHGLTQKQADGLRQDWLQYELSMQGENSAELDKTFDKIKSEHFGDDFDKLQADAVAFIDGKLPEDMDAHVRQAFTNDPITQGAFIKLIESMNTRIAVLKKEYGAEGNLGSGQQSSGRSLDDIRADLAKLNTSEANRNFDHPEHKATRQKIEALRGELQRALK